jgi:hypothetical protein
VSNRPRPPCPALSRTIATTTTTIPEMDRPATDCLGDGPNMELQNVNTITSHLDARVR